MAWPEQTYLTAVDQSEGMLQTIWPGDLPGARTAKQGNWLELPIPDGTCSVVVGDGSFNCIEYSAPYHRLAAEVARVLHDDGVLILRFYARPEQPLAVDRLFQELCNGHFSTFDGFKFLLLMAQVDEAFNVSVRDVWEQWVQADVDQAALCRTTGWPMTQFETIAYTSSHLLVSLSLTPRARTGSCAPI